MRIGITYDLREEYLAAGHGEEETAEFDRPDTIAAIDEALQALGHETERIGSAKRLVERLAAGGRWDLVFNICEGLKGMGRESQVPAILEVYDIPYTFSDPVVMGLCMHKGLAKTAVAREGIPTPTFAVVAREEDLLAHGLPYPVFVKPVAEGTGKGVTPASIVETPAALQQHGTELLRRYQQPVIIETFLPGREFTVSLLGTGPQARILGTLEIVLLEQAEPGVYSYVNKEFCESLVEYRWVRPEEDDEVARAEAFALRAWRALECRDAGRIDLRSDGRGVPNFLEANPLAGLHPSHSDLPIVANAMGFPYLDIIRSIVDSAALRRT